MRKIIPLLIIALILYGCFNYLNIKLNKNTGDDISQDVMTNNNSDANSENNAKNSDTPVNAGSYYSHIVYYSDSNGYLVPVLRKLPKNASLAKTALSALYINESNKDEIYHLGLVTTIPENIEISLALQKDGLIRVSMSNEVMNIKNKEKEELLLKSMVYTLTEFDNISKVQFLIDKKQVEVLSGGAIASGIFVREDINAINSAGKSRLNLYYCNTFYPSFYVFPITLYTDTLPNDAKALLELLIENSGKVKTDFNLKNENIKSAQISGNRAIIELNGIEGDNIVKESILKCVALTLQDNFSITGAEININGENHTINLPIAPNEL